MTNLIGDQIMMSTIHNLSWYNAIALMNTIFALMKLYFPVTLFNIWLEDISLILVFGTLIGYINYKVVGNTEGGDSASMGLHTKMIYISVLVFLATTTRSLILTTL